MDEEAVDLRSTEVPISPSLKGPDFSYQAALPEIRNLLRCECETHKLPLALWCETNVNKEDPTNVTLSRSCKETQLSPSTPSQEVDFLRIKVSYEEEKIRFRMQNSQDVSRYDLKYLDEDDEWVLLRCDDDVEECVDVCRSFPGKTIKLCFSSLLIIYKNVLISVEAFLDSKKRHFRRRDNDV
ncbi:hypothetical protein IGI04_027922, partial [Brassica rapa subsp. trilocularis]